MIDLINHAASLPFCQRLLLRDNAKIFSFENFAQVCNIPGYEHERKLHPDDLPLNVQAGWKSRFDSGNNTVGATPNTNMATSPQTYFSFVLKRNPDNSAQMARRRVI